MTIASTDCRRLAASQLLGGDRRRRDPEGHTGIVCWSTGCFHPCSIKYGQLDWMGFFSRLIGGTSAVDLPGLDTLRVSVASFLLLKA